jgi:ribosomal protein L20A (L18A)
MNECEKSYEILASRLEIKFGRIVIKNLKSILIDGKTTEN